MNTLLPRIPARLVCALGLAAALAFSIACLKDRDPANPPEAETAATGRPANAVFFNGHWYKVFITEQSVAWREKKALCEAMGGHLACVETEEEQAFIAKLADGKYLSLGATNEEDEEVWKWVNGAPFEFTAWMPGQPNNYGGEENFLATYDEGLWVDVDAAGDDFWLPVGFICEWDK